MWDFFETVRHRHSVRRYQSDMPVEDEKLHAVLETACAAPSAGDLQAYKIYAVHDGAKRRALSEAANHQEFVEQAPVCLVFCADAEVSAKEFGQRGSLFAVQDATIAAAYSQLAIVAAGLVSTWVGRFDEQNVQRVLGISNDQPIVALISLGYPAEIPEETPRRSLDQIVVNI